eukprot:35617_1
MDFKRLKTIDKLANYLVFGYIRQLQLTILKCVNFPASIYNICLLFYQQMDEWDASISEISQGITINSNNKRAIRSIERTRPWLNAFGKQTILPNDYIKIAMQAKNQQTIIKSWRLKIVEMGKEKYDGIFTGIISDSKINGFREFGDYFCANYKQGGYGLYGNHIYPKKQKTLNIRVKMNDVLEVILLLQKNKKNCDCCLAFRKGTENVEIAVNNLDMNEKYRIAVAFYKQNDCVELLN